MVWRCVCNQCDAVIWLPILAVTASQKAPEAQLRTEPRGVLQGCGKQHQGLSPLTSPWSPTESNPNATKYSISEKSYLKMHPAHEGNRLEGQQSPAVCTYVKRRACITLPWHHAGSPPWQKRALCYRGLQKSAHIDSEKSGEEGRLRRRVAITVLAVGEICCFISGRARATPGLCPKDTLRH